MRVSDAHRVLFVHVQKTGGSTVDHVFDTEVPDARRVAGRPRHSSYKKLVAAEPELADYWSFAFVRNPWARIVSWYTMVNLIFTKRAAGDPIMVTKVERWPGVWLSFEPYATDFDKFVLEGIEANPKVRRPQLDTISARDGKQVDFIGRTETFTRDLDVVREHLGLAPAEEVPRLNATARGHYSEWFGDVTRRKVEDLYRRDIEAFGYEFEQPST